MTGAKPATMSQAGESSRQSRSRYLMPAEWDRHDATWIAWPHHAPDWPGKLGAIPWVYAEIVRALHAHERVEILCNDENVRDAAAAMLTAHNVAPDGYRRHIVATDRVWLRDSAPTFVWTEAGSVEMVSWHFNAWAKYDNHRLDTQVGAAVARITGLARVEASRPDDEGEPLVLEGGGIEVDGAGRVLVTEEWLLSDIQVRNPGMTRESYEEAFARYLGATETVWLGKGSVGDDTHGHIDDIARFANRDTVILAYEHDPADDNHARSADNLRRLELASKTHGLRIVTIPFPRPVVMNGERLPASYANFYIANKIVLVPTYRHKNDAKALEILQKEFADRRVIGIDSTELIWGLGSFHCISQQEPA